MNSTPGASWPSVLSFSILCSSRPILVSSISIVPSSTHCSMAMRRTWAITRRRSSIVRRESCSKASRAAATASSASVNRPKRPVWAPFGDGAAAVAVGPEPAEHLLNHVADHGFADLHGEPLCQVTRGTSAAAKRRITVFPCRTRIRPDVDRVDDADDHRVDGEILGLRRQPGLEPCVTSTNSPSPAPTVSTATSVRPADFIPRRVLVDAIRLDDQQLVAHHGLGLLRRRPATRSLWRRTSPNPPVTSRLCFSITKGRCYAEA